MVRGRDTGIKLVRCRESVGRTKSKAKLSEDTICFICAFSIDHAYCVLFLGQASDGSMSNDRKRLDSEQCCMVLKQERAGGLSAGIR